MTASNAAPHAHRQHLQRIIDAFAQTVGVSAQDGTAQELTALSLRP